MNPIKSPVKRKKAQPSTIRPEMNIEQAEHEVEKNTAEFETALEHLEEKIENTSQKIQGTIDLVKNPRQVLNDALDKARSSLSPTVERIRENPSFYGALTLIGGVIFIGLLLKSRRDAITLRPDATKSYSSYPRET